MSLVALAPVLGAHAAGGLSEGSIEPSFSGGEYVRAVLAANDSAYAVAIQPDGKIVIAGQADDPSGGRDVAIVRDDADGQPDPTFSGDGKVTTALGTADVMIHAMALEPDGRIVVAGSYDNGVDAVEVVVFRYLPNGQLDTSFHSTGHVITALGDNASAGEAVGVDRSGRIVVGASAVQGSQSVFGALRYLANGSLDPTFGTNGKVVTPIAAQDANPRALVIQSDGKIVLTGTVIFPPFNTDFALVRYTKAGVPDPAFDADGIVTTNVNAGASIDSASGLALQADGDLVVAGDSYDLNTGVRQIALVRYRPDGSLDPSLDGDGIALDAGPGPGNGIRAKAVAIQPDGKIVVGGAFDGGTNTHLDTMVARFDRLGHLDRGFGVDGRTVTPVASADDELFAVAIQPDGQIVGAGEADNSQNYDFEVTRYVGDATAPYLGHLVGTPTFSTTLHRTFYWTVSDDNTGVRFFDVRRRHASHAAVSYGAWHEVLTRTPLPTGRFSGQRGNTDCYEVRGVDFAGNVGGWSAPSCVGYPVDDRAMVKHGLWQSGHDSRDYAGTIRSSTSGGASLTLRVAYRTLALVATTCSTCGSVKVFLGSTLLKKVSLHSAHTRHQVLLPVSTRVGVATGTVKIVQASAGKPTSIDGVAVNLG